MPRAGSLSARRRRTGPDEHIDDVFPAPEDERRDDAAGHVIKPSADEGETRARQIDNRWREIQLPGKPGLDLVLVRAPNVRQVVGKQRADMAGHEFVGRVGAP